MHRADEPVEFDHERVGFTIGMGNDQFSHPVVHQFKVGDQQRLHCGQQCSDL